MPKRVAEHQMPDAQPLRLGRHPGRDAHCFPDVFVRLPGRLEMIDEGDPVESAGFGMLGPSTMSATGNRTCGRNRYHSIMRPPFGTFSLCAFARRSASLLFLLC